MEFPVYRKYPNHLSFFRIDSSEEFSEIKVTGKASELHTFTAKILPDRLFIQDMIDLSGGFWVESNLKEWESAARKLK